jgi:hypothetical protein
MGNKCRIEMKDMLLIGNVLHFRPTPPDLGAVLTLDVPLIDPDKTVAVFEALLVNAVHIPIPIALEFYTVPDALEEDRISGFHFVHPISTVTL